MIFDVRPLQQRLGGIVAAIGAIIVATKLSITHMMR